MKKTEVTLNDKGILCVVMLILILTFVLGYMVSPKREQEATIFTREDLDRIVELQQLEDARDTGAEIYAFKDENGNLVIGWDYDSKKKK